jgi:hypothetical protein
MGSSNMSVATLLELLELLPPPMGTGESNKFNQEEIRKRTKLDSDRSERARRKSWRAPIGYRRPGSGNRCLHTLKM